MNDSFTLDPQTSIIPERDLYRLIIKSKLPSAEKFENWVVSEVLPSIRKTGSYSVSPSLPTTFAEALKLAYEQQLQIEQSAALVAVLQPKADFFDAVTENSLNECWDIPFP